MKTFYCQRLAHCKTTKLCAIQCKKCTGIVKSTNIRTRLLVKKLIK